MQYIYSKKNFTPSAKPTRVIGGMDNQKTDEWSSTVLTNTFKIIANKSRFINSLC